ncbi:hypothetical protein DCW30_14160 [Streptomyces alfalfae]|uniref:DUF8017 domain-containing protein n=1 Tax=Streptomyces alfalfae TaxID=1642299 RepID=A0ABM6GZG7_9ACTN|nr:hypothetical protein [Streptomyces alfalfae]APY89428.1 hypothetical protein A7J05_30395 [Streptomyces alfalfae]AYA19860.1 hypothetical protein D3X13_29660 [Streptomyces fradiae]RXX44002.1 hypothetical protein DCW30_14160 [Streptomyces alfalfae]RZN04128.1 hypothetical protein D4104_03450 [Streptomyces alfalfae]
MWPGQQPPGGEQNQPEQHPNPYLQPGYQQTDPQAGPAPWNAPTMPGGPGPTPPGPPSGSGGRTKVIALCLAAAVVVGSAVTGYLVLGGDKDDEAKPEPTEGAATPSAGASGSDSNPRDDGGEPKPTIKGWQVITNPARGIAFEVPRAWAPQTKTWVHYVSDDKDPEDKPLVTMGAPALLKEEWCGSDEDKNGKKEYSALAAAGSRGNRGAKNTDGIARRDARDWVYGGYTQPSTKEITVGEPAPYTTASGLKGSLVTASSEGVEKESTCDSDGKATVFAFKNAEGEFASWSFAGAKGVPDEVPDTTVKKILSTVRLYEAPED